MPNYQTPEVILIRRQAEMARKRQAPPPRSWPSSPRAAAPRVSKPSTSVPLLLNSGKAPPLRLPGTLTAARLKVSVLGGAELLAVPAPEGRPRVTLRVRLPDRTVTADIAARSLRKAQRAFRETGADNVALVLQRHLAADGVIADAGLSAQPKAAKARQAP